MYLRSASLNIILRSFRATNVVDDIAALIIV